MSSENKIISQLEMKTDGQSSISVSLKSSHSGERIAKGMVFDVKFFDEDGVELKEKLFNFSTSQKYLNYRYVFTGNSARPHTETLVFLPPKSANRVAMTLSQWTFLSNPKGGIEPLGNGHKDLMDLSKRSFQSLSSINQYWSYSFWFKFVNTRRKVGRIALLLIRYYDKNNVELMPKVKEQLLWSTKYKGHCKYISSGHGEFTVEYEHRLYPPENADFVEIELLEWNNSEVQFEWNTPKEASLQWDHSDKHGLLNESMVSHSSHTISLEKQIELASHVSTKQHYELVYDFHMKSGDLHSALSVAKSEYTERPSKRTLHRIEFVSQLMRSLDVTWSPTLHSSREVKIKSNPNKILHLFKVTYPFESTGGSIRNLNIVESQKDIGINPLVVTPLNYPRMFGVTEFELEEEVRGVRNIRLDAGNVNYQSASYICDTLQLNTQLLAGLIRKEQPAVIHAASGYKGYELASMAKVLSDHFSIPWIYEVRSFHEHTWTNDVFYANNSWHTKQRILKENSLMMGANHVVTISQSMKEALIDRGVPDEKITIIPNAVDVDKFLPKSKSKKLARELGVGNKNVLGYISNISKREGHEILIKALPLILEKYPNTMILIVGDGPEKGNLQELASDLGIRNEVIFTGKVDHSKIQDYYRMIDLFVVPRKRDYASDLVTPLKPYEAMALEIPLIVSDRKALIEIIGEDRGYSFKTENVEDLSRVVSNCLENLSECKRRAKKARIWLSENRTWGLNAETYCQLYKKILAEYDND
tara:strand:+ start:12193 stop:14472 length:2280 start_codon:yes stop_codon:yes gene_type:complete